MQKFALQFYTLNDNSDFTVRAFAWPSSKLLILLFHTFTYNCLKKKKKPSFRDGEGFTVIFCTQK